MTQENNSKNHIQNISYINEESAIVHLNPNTYNLDVIYSAAHILTDRAYFLLDGKPNTLISVTITRKTNNQSIKQLTGDFLNELINYSVNKNKTQEMLEFRNIVINKILSTNIDSSNNTNNNSTSKNQNQTNTPKENDS